MCTLFEEIVKDSKIEGKAKAKTAKFFLLIVLCILLVGCGRKEKTHIEAEVIKEELKQQDQNSLHQMSSTVDLSKAQEKYKVPNEFSTCFMGQDGKLQLELYIDKETGKSYGWKYGESVDNGKFPFVCDSYSSTFHWNYPNPYATDVTYDDAAILETNWIPDCIKQEFDSYDYNYNYDLEGRISSYILIGYIKDHNGNAKQDEIYKVSYLYRKQGTLWKKEYWYNENLFDDYGARSQYYLYDELERLQYISLNNRRNQWEDYYFCYEEESIIPFSCLMLMEHIVAVYETVGCDSWVWVPQNGVDAFLQQAGLTKQEVFYQYQWHNDNTNGVIWQHSDINLTLYYNEEKEIGCGFLEYPEESINMDGFLFTGCIKVDCSKVNPNGAYDYYSYGEEVYCYPMEELSADYCDYNGDKLLRSILLGNTDIERFYIYNEDNTFPLYCLNLMQGSRSSAALIKFNWQ